MTPEERAAALQALEDSKVPHEKVCTCSGCQGVRSMSEIVKPNNQQRRK